VGRYVAAQSAFVAATVVWAALVSPSTAASTVYGQGTWESTLQPRDLDGDGNADAFYDTSLNITWLGDLKAAAGSSYDDGASPADGGMTWQNAVDWAANFAIGGFDDWRLAAWTNMGPSGCNETFGGTDCGFNVNVSSGEMAHMYYETLGNLAQYDTSGQLRPDGTWGLINTGPFWNIPNEHSLSSYQWLGNAIGTDRAMFFYLSNGLQVDRENQSQLFAWSVHDGDIGEIGVWIPRFRRIPFNAALGGSNPGRLPYLNDVLPDAEQKFSTFWRNSGTAATAWFTLDFGSELSIYELKLAPRGDVTSGLAIAVGNTLANSGKVSGGTLASCQTWGIDSATPTYLQSCYLSASGRYVTVQGNQRLFRVHGVEVYGTSPGSLVPQPTAQYSFVVDSNSLNVDFDASASSDPTGNVVHYDWSFGDGSTGTGAFASHQYASEGQYRVTLTVTNDRGVKAAQSKRPSVYFSGLTFINSTIRDAGVNDATSPRIVDRIGTMQNLGTAWSNDGTASTAWFTLDLGSSRSIGELRIAPRADRNYNLEVRIGSTLASGKVSGPVAGYCIASAGPSQVPSQMQKCSVSGRGRYVTLRETDRRWLTFHGLEVLGTP
jgi:hypothetical protein